MTSEPSSIRTPVPPQVVDAALQSWGKSGRQSTFTVSGQSMEPFLFAGDELLIIHGKDNIHIGGLIAYRQGDHLVVHRLLRAFQWRGEPMMLLRGDNNDAPDPLILLDRLVGRVSAVHRGGRSYAIETPLWRAGSLLIALLDRFPITFDQWATSMRRRLLPGRPASESGRSRRVLFRVFDIPARLLTHTLWKIARHDRL